MRISRALREKPHYVSVCGDIQICRRPSVGSLGLTGGGGGGVPYFPLLTEDVSIFCCSACDASRLSKLRLCGDSFALRLLLFIILSVLYLKLLTKKGFIVVLSSIVLFIKKNTRNENVMFLYI